MAGTPVEVLLVAGSRIVVRGLETEANGSDGSEASLGA